MTLATLAAHLLFRQQNVYILPAEFSALNRNPVRKPCAESQRRFTTGHLYFGKGTVVARASRSRSLLPN